MAKHALKIVWMLAVACSVGCTHAPPRPETILFVGNSFTFGAQSVVQRYRPETVHDLNHDGMGGIPALFKAFTRQAGLHLSLIHISEPTRLLSISYAVFCLKKKK